MWRKLSEKPKTGKTKFTIGKVRVPLIGNLRKIYPEDTTRTRKRKS